jgi:hypothetical protein
MIARNQQRTDEEYADYHAYSNQNFLSDGSMGDPRGNIRLFPKAVQRDIEMPIDYSGGITARNMEGGYGPLRREMNSVALGEDTRRYNNKGSSYSSTEYPFYREGHQYHQRDIYSSESEEEEIDEMTGSGVPSHSQLLKHLSKMKLPKGVHSEIEEWLEEMEMQGRGMEGRGGVWDWIKDRAGDVGKLIKDNIKPIAKFAMPFLKKLPGVGKVLDKASTVAKMVPGASGVLKEYGLGRHGGGVSYLGQPESGDHLTDVRTVGRAMPAAMMEANENPLIGVPMRHPGYMKSTGLHFEGASLGAGKKKRGRPCKVGGSVIGGPSNDPVNGCKITGGRRKKGKGDKAEQDLEDELSDIFEKKASLVERINDKKVPIRPRPSSVAPPKSPEEKRKREKSDSPKEVKKTKGKGKTGSALFKKKGAFPLESKVDVPMAEEGVVTDGEVGQGRKRRGGSKDAKSALSPDALAEKMAKLGATETMYASPQGGPPKMRASVLKAPAVKAAAAKATAAAAAAAAPEPPSTLSRQKATKKKPVRVDTSSGYTNMYEDMTDSAPVPDQGNGRKRGPKKGGMLKSQMPGSSFSGMGKKTSAWIDHCKAYAKAHGVPYRQALKDAKASYKK